MISSKAWWGAAAVRALKTFCQVLVAMIPLGVGITAGTDWASAGWAAATMVGTAVLAAVFSLLTSLAGLPEVSKPS